MGLTMALPFMIIGPGLQYQSCPFCGEVLKLNQKVVGYPITVMALLQQLTHLMTGRQVF